MSDATLITIAWGTIAMVLLARIIRHVNAIIRRLDATLIAAEDRGSDESSIRARAVVGSHSE